MFTCALVAWEAIVRFFSIPAYILPAPSLVAQTLVRDRDLLFSSLLVTLAIIYGPRWPS